MLAKLKRKVSEVELQRSSSGGSPGLVVMGGDSCSKGCGFESWHRILDGHDIFHIYLL